MTVWQLSMGRSKAETKFTQNIMAMYNAGVIERFSYPKGNAKMINNPKLNDEVHVAQGGKLVMKGKIEQEFHDYNGQLVATVKILSTHDDILKGFRRNWMKINH